MTATRLSRRSLFGLGGDPASERPAFSLGGFYARRPAAESAGLPVFALRDGLPDVETSSVGCTQAPAMSPPWATRPASPAIDGVVRVRLYACLAHHNSPCSVCSERCPEEGAIVVTAGRPVVVAERCTGCGASVAACPAPVNGFDIVPRST